MALKRALTRALMNRLPEEAQVRMVAGLISWLFKDLSPAGQREMIERLGPRLLERMRQGRSGLPLILYTHLSNALPLLRNRQGCSVDRFPWTSEGDVVLGRR